jgi:hypothetical protein
MRQRVNVELGAPWPVGAGGSEMAGEVDTVFAAWHIII